jgi:hypothetical protein
MKMEIQQTKLLRWFFQTLYLPLLQLPLLHQQIRFLRLYQTPREKQEDHKEKGKKPQKYQKVKEKRRCREEKERSKTNMEGGKKKIAKLPVVLMLLLPTQRQFYLPLPAVITAAASVVAVTVAVSTVMLLLPIQRIFHPPFLPISVLVLSVGAPTAAVPVIIVIVQVVVVVAAAIAVVMTAAVVVTAVVVTTAVTGAQVTAAISSSISREQRE